jgi:hypothetical protein
MSLYEIVIAVGVVGMCAIVMTPLLMKKPCMGDDMLCACPDCTRIWGRVSAKPIGLK